jgi:hypothetical protein
MFLGYRISFLCRMFGTGSNAPNVATAPLRRAQIGANTNQSIAVAERRAYWQRYSTRRGGKIGSAVAESKAAALSEEGIGQRHEPVSVCMHPRLRMSGSGLTSPRGTNQNRPAIDHSYWNQSSKDVLNLGPTSCDRELMRCWLVGTRLLTICETTKWVEASERSASWTDDHSFC